MRRYESPFNGKQYLFNSNTGEIHNLDNEQPNCKIDQIKANHIHMADTYEDAKLLSIFVENNKADANGCHHCLPDKDNG